jgi:hypothetical protein
LKGEGEKIPSLERGEGQGDKVPSPFGERVRPARAGQ